MRTRSTATWLLATCCTASALIRVPVHHVQPSSSIIAVGTTQPLLATRPTAAAAWPATLATRHRRHAVPRAGLLQKGVAGVVAYTCVSTGWYAVGVSLCLFGLPAAAAMEPAPVRQALGRVGKAYAITFAASQLSAPWRAATAAAMLPLVARILFTMRARLGVGATSLVPAALLFAAAAATFVSVMAALLARELALLRALPHAADATEAQGAAPAETGEGMLS